MDWFYAKNNQQNGPVTLEALASLLQQGHVLPSDLVWHDGMPAWQPAGVVPELNAASAAATSSIGYFNPVAPGSGGPPQYAGFWLRWVAVIIDSLLLGVVGFVIGLMTGMQGRFLSHRAVPMSPSFLVSMAFGRMGLSTVIGWLYYALMESSRNQATLGKMALGLTVTDLQGNPVTFGRATGRYFGKFISNLTLYIGYMMAGWTQQKQALHDIMASCLVLQKRR
jgi:uncharacterized RDD family membrane protein YckC